MSSSRITYTINANIPSIKGPSGSTGPTGPVGPTGPTGFGITGATGLGVCGATGNNGVNSTAIYFYANGLSFIFVNLVGNPGDGTNSLQTFKIDSPAQDNPDISVNITENRFAEYFRNEIAKFRKITLASNILTLKGTENNTTVGIFGGTTDNVFPLGNTGEILYVNNQRAARGAKNTLWEPEKSQMHLNFAALKEPLYQNKNYDNVNGSSGPFQFQNFGINQNPTSFIFYNNYEGGLTFGIGSLITTISPELIANQQTEFYELNPIENTDKPFTVDLSLFFGITGGSLVNRINFTTLTGYTASDVFSPQFFNRSDFGSCCFCDRNTQDKICTDYVSRQYCESIYGNFSSNSCYARASSSDCFFEGTCCVFNSATNNTKCLNTTEAKCAQFNGLFTPGKVCNLFVDDEDYFACPTNFCTPNLVGRCCSKGRCFNLTQNECFAIPGTLFYPGEPCASELEDGVCCYADNVLGACCSRTGNCIEGLSAEGCTLGIFMGAGTYCDTVSCCDVSGEQLYFTGAESTSCRAYGAQQIINCLNIGDKVAGGYFAGFIGMPNPCSFYFGPQLAFGEPLECMITPRGNMATDLAWRCKTCLGNRAGTNNASIEYFARTYPERLPLASRSAQCLLKAGVPFIQQAYSLNGITWGDPRLYIDSPAYNEINGTYSYDISNNNGIAVEYMPEGGNLYKYLAKDVYGANKIQILWALIVGPEDVEIEGSKNLRWGMSEGRHIPNVNGAPSEILLEEVTTYPVDGLLTTRIYDRSSIQNPKRWFRDLDGDGTDNKAYLRFSNGAGSMWNSTVSRQEISSDINKFKLAYTQLWEDNNPVDSAIRAISNVNDAFLYGYRDWYIPSITELNYIYNSIDTINSAILLDGAKPLIQKEYWSSTSVCRLVDWNRLEHTDKDQYKLEQMSTQKEPWLGISSNRVTSTNNFGINQDGAYMFMMSVCNGQKMLTQVFNSDTPEENGKMLTRYRDQKIAGLRPVRRIPIVVTCDGFYFSDDILSYDSFTALCPSCIDNIEGMCS